VLAEECREAIGFLRCEPERRPANRATPDAHDDFFLVVVPRDA